MEKVKSMDQDAVAITDHGVAYGLVKHYQAALEHDIKPILGCEVYTTEDRLLKDRQEILEKGYDTYHLTLLAKNNDGLKNLNRLLTDAHLNGFYYRPRTDREQLRKYSDGLVALSGCMAGEIHRYLTADEWEQAADVTEAYLDIFGDDFYLELQANEMDEQYELNKRIVQLNKQFGIPLVATSDAHYLDPEDAKAHEIMLAIQTDATLDDEDRLRFDNDRFYLKTEEEIRANLFDEPGYEEEIEEAVANTEVIGEACNVELDLGGMLLPDFETPEEVPLEEYLEREAFRSLFEYATEYDIDLTHYSQRLRKELDVINEKGYPGYFLITADFIRWAKDNGVIVGPGRGSATGCLLSYLLGITSINPIEHELLFERCA